MTHTLPADLAEAHEQIAALTRDRDRATAANQRLRADLDAALDDGTRLRTALNADTRRVRAYAIREAIIAVAAHGPGVDWMAELEAFAKVVETPDEETDQ